MTTELSARERILVAYDVNDLDQAAKILANSEGMVGTSKVGMEAIASDIGHPLADRIIDAGGLVFWDEKWNDIPNTVAGAARGLRKRHPHGIWAFNVHASGGIEMMQAAVDNKGDSLVLAVTVLTSLHDSDVEAIYHVKTVKAAVHNFARQAKMAGVDGLICSPQEVEMLRADPDLNGLIYVTPAIRPDWSVPADQARPTTPRQAILAGSTYLVIGRPITSPPDRTTKDAIRSISEEIEEALIDRRRHEII